ncbi:MAG TPA: DUF3052 family protein [Longimicrobiales bacterium]|nr:DUF3052 family protein [Longimicrobiales bacterium]
MSAGYSGTPLARKLGHKEGHRVASLGAPEHFPELLEPLPASVRLRPDLRGRGSFDVLVAFVRTPAELRRRFEQARRRLEQNGGLWVSWPKQSSPLATDLRESDVRAHGLAAGLVDNKVCAIDEDWSGLRFVVRLRDRR